MTPEGKVKKQVTAILKQYGAYYFSPVTGGFGASGVPDIIACYKGRFIAIECKAGNNKPTALQLKNIDDIDRQGGITAVINEDNIWTVERFLKYLGEKK
jgi:Holliday junction resolvase